MQQKDLTSFTAAHPSNTIVALFGKHFLSLDWDFDAERLYGFETFKEQEHATDIVAALPDNSHILFYRSATSMLYSLDRKKKKGITDKVFETTKQGKLQESRHSTLKKLMKKILKTKETETEEELFFDRGAIEKHFMRVVRSRFDFVETALDRANNLMSLQPSNHKDANSKETGNEHLIASDPILKKYMDNDTYMAKTLQELTLLAQQEPREFTNYMNAQERGDVQPPELASSKPVDFLYKHDAARNNSVLLTVNSGGLVSSYLIKENVQLARMKK